jgi:hypothetical protein
LTKLIAVGWSQKLKTWEIYPKSHNSNGALLNTKVVSFQGFEKIHSISDPCSSFQNFDKTFGLVWTKT